MIRSRIQIEGGEVRDFYEAFGFIYMDADERTAPDEKEDAASSYAEQAGENRDGRTVDAPFDYTARFIVEARGNNADNINRKIRAFNEAVREQLPGSDVKRKKEICFYNLNNRCKVVGTAEVIAVPKEAQYAHRAGLTDFADVELKIHVTDPKKCNFSLDGYLRLKWAEGTDEEQWRWKPNGQFENLEAYTGKGSLITDALYEGELTTISQLFGGEEQTGVGKLEHLWDLPDTSKAKRAYFAFGLQSQLEYLPEMDLASAENVECMFLGCLKLKAIRVRNTGNVMEWGQFANNCKACERIEELDFRSMKTMSEYTFPPENAPTRYIRIKNLGMGEVQTIVIRCANWGAGSAENFQSLWQSLVVDSYNLRENAPMSPPKVLQLHPSVLSRLGVDGRELIKSKGYTLTEY